MNIISEPTAQVVLGAVLSFLFAAWIKKEKTKGRILYYIVTVTAFPTILQILVFLFSGSQFLKFVISASIYLFFWMAAFLLLLFGQIRAREKLDEKGNWTEFEKGFVCSLLIFVFLLLFIPANIFIMEAVWALV